MSGRIIPTILRKGQRCPGIGALSTFWFLMVGLGTVMMSVGVLFSLLLCSSESIRRLKV